MQVSHFLLTTLAAALCACSGGGGGGSSPPAAPPTTVAPTLSYADPGAPWLAGVVTPTLEPTLGGDAPDSFAVAPALPAGLALDPATGVISGVPEGSSPETTHTVTATNAGGSGQAELTLRVLASFDHARFAYVTERHDATVSVFLVDPTSGRLRHRGWVEVGDKPLVARAYPTGEFLYVTNFGSSSVSAFAVDRDTGELTLIEEELTSAGPVDLVIDSQGRYVYVTNHEAGLITTYRVDRSTGALDPVGAPVGAINPAQLAVSADGRFLYCTFFTAAGVGVYSLDPLTGAPTLVSATPTGEAPIGVALLPSGDRLVVADYASDTLSTFAVDPDSGALTSTGTHDPGDGPVGLTVADGLLYAANFVDNTAAVFDTTDGSFERVQTVLLNALPMLLTAAPDGQTVYVAQADAHEVSRIRAPDPLPLPGAPEIETPEEQVRTRRGPQTVALLPAPTPLSLVPRSAYIAAGGTGELVHVVLASVDAEPLEVRPGLLAGTTLSSLGTDAAGSRVLTADELQSELSVLSIDEETGDLLATSLAVPVAFGVHDVAVDVRGRLAVVAGDDSVQPVAYLEGSGEIDALAAVSAPGSRGSVALDPTGRFAFLADAAADAVRAYSIDAETGELTEVDGSPFEVLPSSTVAVEPALCLHPSGRFLFLAVTGAQPGIQSFAVDAPTGQLSRLQVTSLASDVRGLAATPGGTRLYASTDDGALRLFQLNPLDGLLVDAGSLAAGPPGALAVDPTESVVLKVSPAESVLAAYAIEPGVPSITALAPLALGPGVKPADVLATARLVPEPLD